jgi:translation initiation factor IF-3
MRKKGLYQGDEALSKASNISSDLVTISTAQKTSIIQPLFPEDTQHLAF